MFQDISKSLSATAGPFRDLVNIQTRMLEQLTREQIACTQSCVEVTLEQTRALQQCQTPDQLLQLQQQYAASLELTLRQAGERNLAALELARENLEKVSRESFERH